MHFDNNNAHFMAIQPDNLIYCYKCEMFLTYDTLNETQQAIYKEIVEQFEIIVENKNPNRVVSDAGRLSLTFDEPIKPQTENQSTITEQQAERPTALPEDTEISEHASRAANRRQYNSGAEEEEKHIKENTGNPPGIASDDAKQNVGQEGRGFSKKNKKNIPEDTQFVIYTGPLPVDSSFCLGGGLVQQEKIKRASEITKELEILANSQKKIEEKPRNLNTNIVKNIELKAKYLIDHSIEGIAIFTSGKNPRFEKVIIIPKEKESKNLSTEYNNFDEDNNSTSFLKDIPQGRVGYSMLPLTELIKKSGITKSQSYNNTRRRKSKPKDFIEAYYLKKKQFEEKPNFNIKKKKLIKNKKSGGMELVLYLGPLPIDPSFCLSGGLINRGKINKASEFTQQLAKLAIENKASENPKGKPSKDNQYPKDIEQKAKYFLDNSIEAIAILTNGNNPYFDKVILLNQEKDKKDISVEYEKFEEDYIYSTKFLKSFPQGKIGYSRIFLPKSGRDSILNKRARSQKNKCHKKGKIEDFIEAFFRKKHKATPSGYKKNKANNKCLELVLYAGPLPVNPSFSLGGGLSQKGKNNIALEFTRQIANLAIETKKFPDSNEHDIYQKAKYLMDDSIEAIGILSISRNPKFEKVIIIPTQSNEKNKSLTTEYEKFEDNSLITTSFLKVVPQGKIAYSKILLPKLCPINMPQKNKRAKPEDFIESNFTKNKKLLVAKKSKQHFKRRNNAELVLYAGPITISNNRNNQGNKLDKAYQFTKKLANLPPDDNCNQELQRNAKYFLDHSIEAIALLSIGKNPKFEKVILFSNKDNKELSLIFKKFKNNTSFIKTSPHAKIGYSKIDLHNGNKFGGTPFWNARSQKTKRVHQKILLKLILRRKGCWIRLPV